MLLIAHRGNLNGPNSNLENSPDYVVDAIQQNFDVEVDVWYTNNQLFLGHDNPEYKIHLDFLLSHQSVLWCHAKNIEALNFMLEKDLHCFWHQEDDYTITNKGYIWAYPDKQVPNLSKSITVMPEWHDTNVSNFSGVCSDYIESYKST